MSILFSSRVLCVVVLVTVIATSVFGQTEQCMSGCSAVLQGGVFNEDKINSSQMSKDSFHDWMCVAEFKNHNEAHDAGIDIGVIVYDVPLKVGGTWKDGQQETWKKQSCSDQQRHAEKVSTYARALRTASPDILAAWSKCVETSCSAGHPRVACEVSSIPGATLFKSNWIRQVGEAATSAPKVKFYKAYDARCDRAYAAGQRLTEAVSTFRCTPTTERDAVFILETDGGSCTPAGSALKAKESLTGRISLVAERHIKADTIMIAPDTVIVTNGFKLTLEATEIHLDGSPRIVSFDPPRDGRPAGDNGRNAGPIIFKAAKLTGTSIVIKNYGEDGIKGSPGPKGGTGGAGQQGHQRDWDITGCHGGSNGTDGGPGGTGGDGGPGGRGGNGGAVISAVGSGITAGPIKRIDVTTTRVGPDGAPINCNGSCGGVGAAGGDKGLGGDGGARGEGAPGTLKCGGTDPGQPGGTGALGRVGNAGADGSPGQIVTM
jgi:hypothetical protein